MFERIRYNIIGFVMWISWLPILAWRVGAIPLFKEMYKMYGSITTSALYVINTLRVILHSELMFNLLGKIVSGLAIYFVLLFLLHVYRKAVFGHLMDEDGLTKESIKEEKEEKEMMKLAKRALYGHRAPGDLTSNDFLKM